MASAMAFWSIILPAKGKPVQQEVESTQTVLSSIHVTGLSLGAAPKQGPHVVTLEYNGTNTVLATLEAPHTRQWRLDIAIDQTIQMRNMGESEVHVYGYQVSTHIPTDESDEESEEDEGEDYELDGDDDEEDETDLEDEGNKSPAPAKVAAKAAPTPASDAMDTDEEDEDEDEDDEEEEDDEGGIPGLDELGSDDLVGEAADEGEEEQEEESSEEEQPPVKVGSKRTAQTPQPKMPVKHPRQEPPKSAPPKSRQQQQKPAGARQITVKEADDSKPQLVKVAKDAAAATAGGKAPQAPKVGKAGKAEQKAGKAEEKPAKPEAKEPKPEAAKGKQAEGKAGKAGDKTKQADGKPDGNVSQPPSAAASPKGAKTPGNESEYRSALVDFIGSQKGPVPMSQIGVAVKKPAGVDKLTSFLKKNSDTFVVEGDKVKLAKK